ncbi:heat shock 70 kDa protein 12A-like [Saccostrea echinata]|uniref:heat shock 70 kDa protein 12A-like n=1 Tax=Saccostrea echinata TaxID=191078 RepID=UPI002A81B8B5|nr:heat shock 70 kDa protein 12A-like [Saccostrea echinata]
MASSSISKLNTPSKPQHLFVAAIDFGTTYSGYAFSSTAEWEKVHTNRWRGDKLTSPKAPTVVLLNPDQSFNSFGYTAEKAYSELVNEGPEDPEKPTYKDYYYFQNFKMKLHNTKNVTEGTIIEDIRGKPMQALIIFAYAIRELKNNLLEQLRNAITDAKEKDILYVLTVPAIWDERAKLFMRKAAMKAGIDEEMLFIALEPEAASVFCQTLPFHVEDVGQKQLVKPGTQYMVADLGGGTADLTVHKRTENGKLRELWRASGGPWGGKNVNENFLQCITTIVTPKAMEKLRKTEMDDYLDLLQEIESKKKHVNVKKKSLIIIVPLSLIDCTSEETNYKTLEEAVAASMYASSITVKKNKLTFKKNVLNELFEPIVEEIINKMMNVFSHITSDIPYILLVGGFSECDIVREKIREQFPSKTVIAPLESGLIVLKGAVYYGHLPEPISVRCAPYTYGIQSWPPFDPLQHPRNKRVIINGEERCKDVFFKFVTIGDAIEPGCTKSQNFQILDTKQTSLECIVYVSEEEDPEFVDTCTPLLKLSIPLKDFRGRGIVEIEEALIFGETELRIKARDHWSGVEYAVSKELATRV